VDILILEPYLAGSHAAWAREYAERSSHRVEVTGMDGCFWKWRMHGGAVTMSRFFLDRDDTPDLLVASDMMDLATFLALTRRRTAPITTALYFHENQLTYPWAETDRDPPRGRDMHYAFINYASALAADRVVFNSEYHRENFLEELPEFLNRFPDYKELRTVPEIREKSEVLALGLDLQGLEERRVERHPDQSPLILWNHRWEYDKNPKDFFRALVLLAGEGLDFEVAVLGESFSESPTVFEEAMGKLGSRVVHSGYERDFGRYASWLWRADILPVTSMQDFFGASVVQAVYCDTCPLLPDRLAYPEHIPPERRTEFIYESFEDLVDRLRRRILDIEETRAVRTSDFVRRYDWGTIAPLYDRRFEEWIRT
jgi:glycosyltransferase involved in cell wall biosynthesis